MPREQVANRQGKWFFGVTSIKDSVDLNSTIVDEGTCAENSLTSDMLDSDFKTDTYTFQVYTGGCYFFNVTKEEWETPGTTVRYSQQFVGGSGTKFLSPVQKVMRSNL